MYTRLLRTLFAVATIGTSTAQQMVLSDTGNLNPEVLSSGARAWLLGPTTPTNEIANFSLRTNAPLALGTNVAFGTNVDAADPNEDLQAGQAETAIAASGSLVMAAWNDATGFVVQPSTLGRASVTGVSLSTDSGNSFVDLRGLHNGNTLMVWSGDPGVKPIDARHFIISSLYLPSRVSCLVPGSRTFAIAVSVAIVAENGSVTFTLPIIAASGGNPCTTPPPVDLAMLDKPWISYDANSRTLVLSYTRFFLRPPFFGTGQIEMVRASVPEDPAALTDSAFSTPILIRPEEQGVNNQGSYLVAAPGGDAYLAWERNEVSNLSNGDPFVYIRAAVVPAGATAPSVGGTESPRVVTLDQAHSNGIGGVKSLNSVTIPGYNRGRGNDFPRIAFRPATNLWQSDEVIVVWNDASLHPLGDIFLRALSPTLDFLTPIQKVNDDDSFALHLLPAVSILEDGSISTSWYDRRLGGANSTRTDYFGEIRATADQDAPDFRISSDSTDWLATGSVITPNFGDYTDNFSQAGTTFYLWTDGRIGIPQPFADNSDHAALTITSMTNSVALPPTRP